MDRARVSRWRWRRRGAWLWPTFAAAVIVEAILLNELPVWADGAGGIVPGLLLAGCLNIIVVAVLGTIFGLVLRHRRPDLPRAIATDYAATTLVLLLFAGLLIGGIAHRSTLNAEQDARVQQAVAVSRFVHSQAPDYVGGLATMDTLRLEDAFYRTCLSVPGQERPLCLFVRTDQQPPSVTRDEDRVSNAIYRSRGGFS